MRRMLARAPTSWLCLCGVLLWTACGHDSASPAGSTPTAAIAADYITELVNVMQANSLNRQRVDWTDFRRQVAEKGQGAQKILDLYPAISLALGLLGDHHSFYIAPSGTVVRNPAPLECNAPFPARPEVPPDIGYVRVPTFTDATPGADVAFADSIQDQIRSQDAPGLSGWIVDLRGNGGGNMWPMVAGVGPVLGEGLAGYFVYPSGGVRMGWRYQSGTSLLENTPQSRSSRPYTLVAPQPRVAVLTNALVASSGEAVVVSFRGRPNTRSFGSATCGVSTVNDEFRMSDGATLQLTVGIMADRNLTSYGQAIVPDEPGLGTEEVVPRAIAWLRGDAAGTGGLHGEARR